MIDVNRPRPWLLAFVVVCVLSGCGGNDGDGAMSTTVRMRGVVEGFYGPLYSFEQRRDLLRFLALAGLNTYMYAPKLDPFHRDRWREPYPTEYLDHFGDLTAAGNGIGVRFIYALSPGQGFDPAAGDVGAVQDKLQSLFEVGVRDFCLLFDDVQPDEPGAGAEVQAELIHAVLGFLRGLDARATLSFISNFYAGTAEQFAEDRSPFAILYRTPSSAYFAAYARIPGEVPIMWTGPAVFSHELKVTDAAAMRSYVARPLWVWDNYPVNDAVVANELFLGPYQGRDAELGAAVDAVLLNPMLQPEAGKIALWTAGRFFADGDRYDPWAAWEEALEMVTGGQGIDAVRAVARHFQSHPFIGDDPESPDVSAAAEAFWRDRSAAAEETLREIFVRLAASRTDLEGQLTNRALLAELLEPATKLSLLGEAGLVALDLLAQKREGQSVDKTPLQQRLEGAARIRWLAGANTRIPPALARLIGSREAKPADVFGDFFARALTELEG
jgi:hyaluronoglucosaminidase